MSPSAGRVVPQKVNFWGQGNKEGSPRLPLGEERTNILLLACCYQEGSNPKGCQVAPAAEIASDCGYSAVARPSSGGHAKSATTKRGAPPNSATWLVGPGPAAPPETTWPASGWCNDKPQ
jgi:hypothetical protein